MKLEKIQITNGIRIYETYGDLMDPRIIYNQNQELLIDIFYSTKSEKK